MAYYRFDFQAKIEITSPEDPIEVQFPADSGVFVPPNLNTNLQSIAVASVDEGDVDTLNGAVGVAPERVTYFPPDYAEIWDEYTGTVTVRVYPSETIDENDFVKLEFFGPDESDPLDEQGPTPDEYPTIGAPYDGYPDVDDTDGTGWPWWQDDADAGGTQGGGVYGFTEWVTTTPGLPTYNPPAAGFQLPNLDGGDRYTVGLGLEGKFNPVVFKMSPTPPVELYLKWQMPEGSCDYTYLDKVANFETIQAALNAANEIWIQDGPYAVSNPKWNLYEGCPNGAYGPVPVGAVVAVGAGTYSETIEIDTPGVILGSKAGPDETIIEARGLPAWRADPFGDWGYAAVEISAGGVTFGESDLGCTSRCGNYCPVGIPDGLLHGFTVQNAGRDVQYDVGPPGSDLDGENGTPEDGVDLDADGDVWEDVWYAGINASAFLSTKCDPDGGDVNVYSSTVQVTGSMTQVMTNSNTLVLADTSVNVSNIVTGSKVVDLNNGWAGYVITRVEQMGDHMLTVTLAITQPWEVAPVVSPTEKYFNDGDYFAVFTPTEEYTCPEARIDIRGNVVKNSTGFGIWADTSAVWVDSNEVFGNEQDGFFGNDLRSCTALKICDGCGRTDKMLEVSNNYFHDNGNPGDYGGCYYDNPETAEVDFTECGNLPISSWFVSADAGWECEDAAGEFCGEFDHDGDGCDFESPGGSDSGIYVESFFQGCNVCQDPLYIHDNLIEKNVHAGIWLAEDGADSGTRILWNELFDNGVFGLSSEAECVDRIANDYEEPTEYREVDVIFKYNDITGNGNDYEDGAKLKHEDVNYFGWGVKNWAWTPGEVTGTLNAKENFWNFPTWSGDDADDPEVHPGGPSDGPMHCEHKTDDRWSSEGHELYGMGDAVDKGTFYNPWLAYEDEVGGFDFDMDFVCEDNYKYLVDESADESDEGSPDRKLQSTRPYGSDSLMLQGGWNTLAVPLPLNPNYNTPDELCDLGYFLTNAAGESGIPDRKYEIAYEYDAGDGGWGSAPTFMPPQGYYIKMKEATRFPVIYGAETPVQLPSFSLFADNPADDYKNGWNLVGANFGIDYEDDNDARDDQGRFAVADPDNASDAGEGTWSWQWVTPTVMAEELEFAFEVEDVLLEKLYMYGEDDWYQIGQAWMPIKFAFNAIDPAGVSGGAANITSPGMAAQIDGGWSLPWDAVEGRPVFAGQAYWVFMREDGALNGFEQAPLFMEVSLR